MSNLTIDTIQNAWRRKNALFFGVLIPLSWLYVAITAIRRLAFKTKLIKSHVLPVPVIVVGNINVGGSGKTPVVIWLAEQLKQQGYYPGVISRGYGGLVTRPTEVFANSKPAEVGDEPVLIASRCHCPVMVGADRVHAGLELLKAYPQCNVIISDDGLQHYRLARSVEIAVIDSQIFSNARLLPAGQLRESLKRLKTVDAIIKNDASVDGFNGAIEMETQPKTFIMQLLGDEFYNLANVDLKAKPQEFKRKSIQALAGIGKPQRFFEHLQKLGLTFAGSGLDDHHVFSQQELIKFDGDVVIMTEKDAVKCRPYALPHHWVLPVNAQIDAGLMTLILAKISQSNF